ncbi:cysteine alpha-hairpin motif superfamily [Suillus occidentalis]|nr:cysteine alpha-hairpin motif superfamily [Suillus occidentalis]
MNPLNPQGLKPVSVNILFAIPSDLGYSLNRCCACPETKSARDACFLQNGSEEGKCAELLKKHVECMRGLGFNI